MLLLIALLGTYNVLDIWIKKRKKEITIKRAVGATKNNIIFEFILTLFIISCFSYFFLRASAKIKIYP
uniref:FtsX-like permease family protein n=1 Tax=Weizmannia sp. FSL W8-0676 TaxID=2954703 RepID=UPI00406D41A4